MGGAASLSLCPAALRAEMTLYFSSPKRLFLPQPPAPEFLVCESLMTDSSPESS